MQISARPILLLLAAIIAGVGVYTWIEHGANVLAMINIVCGSAILAVVVLMIAPVSAARVRRESEDICDISPQRQRELVRGTSLYLRELRYRYSIRLDPALTADQRCFSAEVNNVRLGFVPVVITDNTNDREGVGYVAFVHDGKRWRGPGLPCPAGQLEAVRHAAKCVSPLSKDEETRF